MRYILPILMSLAAPAMAQTGAPPQAPQQPQPSLTQQLLQGAAQVHQATGQINQFTDAQGLKIAQEEEMIAGLEAEKAALTTQVATLTKEKADAEQARIAGLTKEKTPAITPMPPSTGTTRP